MKKICVLLILAILCYACTPNQSPVTQLSVSFPEKAKSLTIYEVNIRQHTKEGTISAFVQDLPRLKDLGVGMLWVMPVQPIGIKNRKEPLGSYYSIKDYHQVNSEFGTKDDFKNLVNKAHEIGMYVILDWVPNHTAWDHPWISSNPDYYAQNEKGEIVYEADWSDIALLNHLKPETRKAMIAEMKYWVTEFDIDGFRCDHAGHEIPLYFWEECRDELDKIKDLFWLAEWDGARMHLEFNATYAWELLRVMDKVGKGEAHARDIAEWIDKDVKEYGHKPFRMTMITNHDENSWQGTEFERYGEGVKTFATFIFTAYGIPMLYTGQEVGLQKRLKFFSKDTIDWSDPMKLQPFYKQLVTLKTENPALWAGKFGAMTERISNDVDVYGFKRVKDSNRVIGIMNFSGKLQNFVLTDTTAAGSFKDYFTGKSYELAMDKPLMMEPWQYLVFVEK